MNVANVLPIGWPKLDEWPLAKIIGYLGFYMHSIGYTSMFGNTKRGFLVATVARK